MSGSSQKHKCKNLVLDAGPLLSLSPLRGLAETYYTTPQVLAELKDNRAREHFEKLGLLSGVKVAVKSPDAASISNVIQWAKKTGDYSVLSHADMCVIALTHMLNEENKKEEEQLIEQKTEPSKEVEAKSESDNPPSPQQLYDDPSSSDDGEGEWITPQNVNIHKSKALDLLPNSSPSKSKNPKSKEEEPIGAGCMTADFAMQNVLLQMNLNLISVDGKRIQKVRNYVLRCHACYKICKDHTKKFCPSCGNPTLLRATVTISSPNASKNAPIMQVHLKPNFQYRTRGSKYSIPSPKPGSAKTGPGEGLILREDQSEYLRAKKHADGKRDREEARMLKGMLNKGVQEGNVGAGVSSWMDPDWIPEIISVGSGGKGRTMKNSKMDGDMPVIGYGRKNPNERRRKR